MTTEHDGLEAVIDAARHGIKPEKLHETQGSQLWFDPARGYHEHNTETGNPMPLRKRGKIVVFDAASFNQLIADNKDAGDISIYFDRNPERPSVVAVLNGHGPKGPGWGDFRAEISFRPTPQWTKWKANDGKMLSQVAFAEFVEDNLEDISDPDGATMLEIVSQLQVIRSVNFRSKVVLQSGAFTFQHDEDDEASVGAGQIAVPQCFKLGIAPIFGLASYEIPARFRYRLDNRKLTFGYKLQRVETMMAQIVEDVIAKIERGVNISVLDGLPPGP